jgi:hypothetical protein
MDRTLTTSAVDGWRSVEHIDRSMAMKNQCAAQTSGQHYSTSAFDGNFDMRNCRQSIPER